MLKSKKKTPNIRFEEQNIIRSVLNYKPINFCFQCAFFDVNRLKKYVAVQNIYGLCFQTSLDFWFKLVAIKFS